MLDIPKRGIVAHCQECGVEVSRRQKFCSESCRKKASRKDARQKTRPHIDHLKLVGMIAQVWPVFRLDETPAVYALMVPLNSALEEVNASQEVLTESEFAKALRDWEIMGPGADLRALIKDRKRKPRN